MRKALEQSQKGELPGGMEEAMLASIFDQSIMSFNNPISTNIADNEALRAMLYHTKDDKTHRFLPTEEGRKSLTKGLMSALQKLRQLARLPDERTLMRMNELDIESMNAEIDEAISQHEDHVKRDNNSIIMLREQNAIIARIVLSGKIKSPFRMSIGCVRVRTVQDNGGIAGKEIKQCGCVTRITG